jgi:4-oxalocrotonate tautomerase
MPTLNLMLSPPQSPARHASLAEALTAITVATLGKRREVTAVLIDERPATRWAIGGRAVQRPTAWLEIRITAGTNSTDQKAAFIAAALAELQQQLAPGAQLEEASYVIVHELPATDWGYGGQTQRARQLARERAAEAHAA